MNTKMIQAAETAEKTMTETAMKIGEALAELIRATKAQPQLAAVAQPVIDSMKRALSEAENTQDVLEGHKRGLMMKKAQALRAAGDPETAKLVEEGLI